MEVNNKPDTKRRENRMSHRRYGMMGNGLNNCGGMIMFCFKISLKFEYEYSNIKYKYFVLERQIALTLPDIRDNAITKHPAILC
jgi:hypothetical protein